MTQTSVQERVESSGGSHQPIHGVCSWCYADAQIGDPVIAYCGTPMTIKGEAGITRDACVVCLELHKVHTRTDHPHHP